MMPRVLHVVALAGVLIAGLSSFGYPARADDATTAPSAEKRAASALEHDVVALLAAVDPTSDLATLQASLAPKLSAAVAKHFAMLKAGDESTVIESTDGRFVVVVVKDSPDGVNGRDARATSDAALLLVVGGNAGPRPEGGKCWGGTGHAEATKGIAIGLGGTGGHGNADGVGGGGGGTAGATGGVGSIALGGAGGAGRGDGGHGTAATGVEPVNLDAIVKAANAWDAAK